MIKNFLYLDQEKMYSLSSQLFEGITEYIFNESTSTQEDSESQKGPIGSGKILADVLKSSIKNTEKKFLHDYSYTLFEKYLIENKRVVDVNNTETDIDTLSTLIANNSFIKIKQKAIFNDSNKITELFSNFNTIGEAIAHATHYGEIETLRNQLKILKSGSSNHNKKSQIDNELKRLTNISAIAKQDGLYQDPKFLSHLELLIKYGFSDQFEIQQHFGDVIYTSCLNRANLRETEDSLIKKYSRKTTSNIVVFGIVCQAFDRHDPVIDDNQDFQNMKAAIMNLVEHLTSIENSISGKQFNEIIIDPLAVYIEV